MDLSKAQTKDLLTWTSLTAAVDARLSPHQFVRKLLYSDVSPQETEEIEVSVIVGARQVAPFVKRNGEAIEVGNYSEDFQNIIAPSVAVKRHLTAKELMNNRRAGFAIMPGKGMVLSAAQQHIARTSRFLADMITEAEEYLCCLTLQGAISYSVAGQASFSITYGRSASHTIDLLSGNYWDEAGGKPIDDFLTARDLVATDTGLTVTDVILGKEATLAFLRNSDVLGQGGFLNNRRIQAGNLDLEKQFQDDGALHLGHFEGLNVWSYSRKTTLSDGTSVDLIRPKHAEFVTRSPSAENVLYYGAIHDIDAMEAGQFVGRQFSKSYKSANGKLMWIETQSRPLPVPRRPDSMISMLVVST